MSTKQRLSYFAAVPQGLVKEDGAENLAFMSVSDGIRSKSFTTSTEGYAVFGVVDNSQKD